MAKEEKDPVIALLEIITREVGKIDDNYIAYDVISARRKGTEPRPITPDIFSFIEALAEKATEGEALKEKISKLLKTREAELELEANKPSPRYQSTTSYDAKIRLKREKCAEINLIEHILKKNQTKGQQTGLTPLLKKCLEESDSGGDR